MRDVHLLSYPRSGNSMVAALMLAAFPGMTFESIYQDNEDDAPRFLVELGALGVVPSEQPWWNLVKTHQWIEGATKIIWIVRDGRDAMTSYWYFKDSERDPMDFWKELSGDPLDGCLSRWGDHVKAVQPLVERVDHLMLRYEDVRFDPTKEVARIGAFLDEKPNLDRLPLVTFRRLQEQNDKFYRSGRVGDYAQLPAPVIDYLDAETQDIRRVLGYL